MLPQEYEDEPLFDDTQPVDEDDVYERWKQDRVDADADWEAPAPVRYQLLTPEQQTRVGEVLTLSLQIERLIAAQRELTTFVPLQDVQAAMQHLQARKERTYRQREILCEQLGLKL